MIKRFTFFSNRRLFFIITRSCNQGKRFSTKLCPFVCLLSTYPALSPVIYRNEIQNFENSKLCFARKCQDVVILMWEGGQIINRESHVLLFQEFDHSSDQFIEANLYFYCVVPGSFCAPFSV